ncbi:MAG: N-succinylglutamate 5-semialdehyde dehydrogenase [Bdellovibrionaceae bacterium]|nr:N-succinylglutamate 5-semialdehyde dehydrogenase [Pseudobdellovibrionaceae bacterium]|tara:strand:- start:143382 stop:144881 length:1500 start_codon:yes stop_codon:yes gene_type:complete
MKTIKFKGDYIGSEFIRPESGEESWEVHSPADLSDLVFEPEAFFSHVDKAVESANNAYKAWRATTLEERKNHLLKLKEVFQKHADEMAEIISRETGKPLWEAKTESAALSAKIDVTIGHSLKHIEGEFLKDALPGVDGVVRFKSRGVFAVLGPFNFPAHLANGHIIPALLTGNTVIFKPSEKTPAVGQFYAEMIHEAGFPKGVFNLLQGKAETGKRLTTHDGIDGILFTGSYEVGLKIKQDTISHFWKMLALEMGGKNATIVWEDALLDKALYETLIGCFLTSGQRCSCTSRVILHSKIYDQFLERFYQNAKKIKIGHWKEDVFMGPLISAEAVEKYIRFQEIAKREGAESIMRGKSLDLPHKGHYVTPSINAVGKFDPKSVYQKSEIFGPNVSVFKVDDFEEAMVINNSTGFGLVTALFSKNKSLYEKTLMEAKVGLVNWNRTTNGASSKLPFGGMGKSGNDRPSGDFAIQYCTVPVSSLEDYNESLPEKLMPGLDFQ